MNRHHITPLWAATVLALAACGGGSNNETDAAHPLDRSTRLHATESTWVQVAAEWQPFSLAAPTRVRYGQGSTWIERDLPAGQAWRDNTPMTGSATHRAAAG
jgi:hypothetical protein